ncbi:MAG: site-specific DNA-methyltransferase [Methylacidiphilales bacterium]|nr:site-specific DNA-methyltransferase [Candidatus Methylacidiphilales bacterium]
MKAIEKQESNVLLKADAPFHSWYRFVLSYPPHLVRKYAEEFSLGANDLLFDPFCGTGTTLVEGKKLGIPSLGSEAHPFAAMVSRVKCNWSLNPRHLREFAKASCNKAEQACNRHGLPPLSFITQILREQPSTGLNGYSLHPDESKMIPTGFMSDRPLGRLLILRHWIEKLTEQESASIREFFYVAMAHVISQGAGNFSFGPEIYKTKSKHDYDVLGHFARQTEVMISDLESSKNLAEQKTRTRVYEDDARELSKIPEGITSVITSPPYPNEKDYTRTTRVESVLLRFMSHRDELRGIKHSLLRSNTRNVFVADQDMQEVVAFDSIQKVCRQIEDRRLELNKTSGFERLYHKVVAHYFGGMKKHFRNLKPKLQSRAKLAYVVGDQYSFLMVPVRTAALLAEVAESEGFRVKGIHLWRERVGTKVRNGLGEQKTVRVREEILMLEMP